MSVLSDRIDFLCQSRGITGYKLCKDIGISPNVMTELRKGRRSGLSAKNANKIASYFGVTVGYLLGTDPEPMLTQDLGDGESSPVPGKEKAPAPLPEDEREAEFLKLFRGLSEAEQERELAYLRERAGGKGN